MSENKLTAAITALLTVGIMLLNLGGDLIKTGDYPTGISLIVMGVALIVAATALMTTLTKTVAEKHLETLKCHDPKTHKCC